MFSPLTPFPDLFSLIFFAPFLLRVGLGTLLFLFGFIRLSGRRHVYLKRFRERWPELGEVLLFSLGGIEIVVGILFILGFYTQIAALVSMAMALLLLFRQNTRMISGNNKPMYFLIFMVSLSLLISGAGAFAFDIPL